MQKVFDIYTHPSVTANDLAELIEEILGVCHFKDLSAARDFHIDKPKKFHIHISERNNHMEIIVSE